MELVTLLAIVVAILYICLYLRGRYYLNKDKEIVLEKYENKEGLEVYLLLVIYHWYNIPSIVYVI
jgi:hypothetical protein